MELTKENLNYNRAAIFDWSVMTVSFLLGFVFPTIHDFAYSSWFSYWMLGVLIAYTIGVLLKQAPLSYRMTKSGTTPRIPPYMLFLLVGHWFIIVVLVILSEGAVRDIFHQPPLTDQNMAGFWVFIISTSMGVYLTYKVYRKKIKSKLPQKVNEQRLFYQELIADFLLVAAVGVMSFAFWEKGAMEMLSRAKTTSFRDIWFLFVFLSVIFLFFYLPLRYLYFVEDKVSGRNRRRLLLIFAFMLLRALFSSLGL